jgi:serine/threonine protein kinase
VNAPEVINDGKYTFASEIWSFGMILLSLWTCNKPFNNELLTNPLVSNLSYFDLCFHKLFKKIVGLLSDMNRSLRRFDLPTLMDELIASDCPHWYGRMVRHFCHHDPSKRPTPDQLGDYQKQFGQLFAS